MINFSMKTVILIAICVVFLLGIGQYWWFKRVLVAERKSDDMAASEALMTRALVNEWKLLELLQMLRDGDLDAAESDIRVQLMESFRLVDALMDESESDTWPVIEASYLKLLRLFQRYEEGLRVSDKIDGPSENLSSAVLELENSVREVIKRRLSED